MTRRDPYPCRRGCDRLRLVSPFFSLSLSLYSFLSFSRCWPSLRCHCPGTGMEKSHFESKKKQTRIDLRLGRLLCRVGPRWTVKMCVVVEFYWNGRNSRKYRVFGRTYWVDWNEIRLIFRFLQYSLRWRKMNRKRTIIRFLFSLPLLNVNRFINSFLPDNPAIIPIEYEINHCWMMILICFVRWRIFHLRPILNAPYWDLLPSFYYSRDTRNQPIWRGAISKIDLWLLKKILQRIRFHIYHYVMSQHCFILHHHINQNRPRYITLFL